MNATDKTLWLIDTTLRDGEQSPGVSFSPKDKIVIATLLAEAGMDELEAGIPAMGESERRDILALNQLSLPCRITSWCRALHKDLEWSADAGAASVHIGFPMSDIHLSVMEKTRESVLGDLSFLVTYARRYFDHVSVGAMDATRASEEFLHLFVTEARTAGAYRVRIADTVGLASPSTTAALIKGLVRIEPNLIYEFHGHNDLGMATANALTAAENGAGALSTTLNGLGERAGNAPTEEVVAALRFASTLSCNVNPARLTPACRYVAQVTKRPVHKNKPITGREVFDHESGIHGHAQLKNPLSFQPFLPEDVGHHPGRLVLGSHSGTATLTHLLGQAGIAVDRDHAGPLMEDIRRFARQKKAALSADDLVAIYHKTADASGVI
ncbi:MAG: homocitrate synthase [Proteobacteria bacterium]|nr:homocitrate synthase [Pseudomonadota bacterium]